MMTNRKQLSRPLGTEAGERCPKCGADFDGGPVPEKHRKHYSPPYRWSRKIGIYNPDKDMTMKWKCPDCGYEWDREGGE